MITKTFMSGAVEEYQRRAGFRAFQSFGKVCDNSERVIKKAA